MRNEMKTNLITILIVWLFAFVAHLAFGRPDIGMIDGFWAVWGILMFLSIKWLASPTKSY
jgi:hypothetical protein